VINAQPGCLFHGLCQQLRATVDKGRVDFIFAKAGDIDVAITWDRDQLGIAGPRNVQQHAGVGTAHADIAAEALHSLDFFTHTFSRVTVDHVTVLALSYDVGSL